MARRARTKFEADIIDLLNAQPGPPLNKEEMDIAIKIIITSVQEVEDRALRKSRRKRYNFRPKLGKS